MGDFGYIFGYTIIFAFGLGFLCGVIFGKRGEK